MTTLSENIGQIISLTRDEKTRVENAFKPVKISKGGLWVNEGKIWPERIPGHVISLNSRFALR